MVTTCPTRAGAMDVQAAVLPFVIPWLGLNPDVEVLSLDAIPSDRDTQNTDIPASNTQDTDAPGAGAQGWAPLLAGLGIPLVRAPDPLPQGCAVLTGFDLLDRLTPEALGVWATQAAKALCPGGLVLLGGTFQHPYHAERQLQILEEKGFSRSRLILSAPQGAGHPLVLALDATGQRYAIVAQTPAHGKAFDVFSPAFLAAPVSPLRTRASQIQTHWEDSIYAHVNTEVTVLHGRISHLDERMTHLDAHQTGTTDALRQRAEAAEQRTQEQAGQITALQEAITRLERATRRRGLRKLVYQVKKKLRTKRDGIPAAPIARPPADAPQTAPAPEPSQDAPATAAAPLPEASQPPARTLSPAEARIHAALFDGPQNTKNE